MYCNQCGAAVNQGSKFCNNCGAQVLTAPAKTFQSGERLSQPSGTFPEAAPSLGPIAEEHVIFTLRPTMVFVIVWYIVATVAVLLATVLIAVLKRNYFSGQSDWLVFFIVLAVALCIYAVPLYKHFLRRREVYVLTNHKLEMRYGILAKTVRNIPLLKIQDVTVTASFWQRLLKLGDIEIDSASAAGKIVLDEVHKPEHYANVILTELRREKRSI